MNDSDLSFIRYASLLRVQQIHPLIDTIIGLLLVIGGILILGLVYGRISLSNRAMRVCLAVFSGALIIGGIDEIAVELLGQARADPVSLVEYVVALSVLTMTLVALPWFVFRATYAHRAIKALKGEIQTTGQMAQEVRAQQDELSRRYAASSAELARATAEAFRFEALVRSSQDAVVGVNEDGTIWHWNPAAEDLYKRKAEDMLGASLEGVQIGPSTNLWRETQRIVALPYLKPQGEVSLVAGDGSVVPVWFSVSRLPDESGGGFSIISRNMSDKKAVEERISAALVEKEALLKEVHHRVKNNLQLICSLLRLQSKEAVDEAALRLFRKSEERIRSLALVHEKLYCSESLSTINFGGYLQDLVGQLVRSGRSQQAPIDVEYSVADLQFPIDTAITCGLIVNELVTNSMKHATTTDGPMEVRVGLARHQDDVLITIWDNGTMPISPHVVEESASLGLSLVRTLTRQLGGSVTVSQNEGVSFAVRLPVAALSPKESAGHRIAA